MRDYQKLRTQDEFDVRRMAHRISSPLHFCTKTEKCDDPTRCDMCSNAARLAVQYYRPLVEERVVQTLMSAYDVQCRMTHPGGD